MRRTPRAAALTGVALAACWALAGCSATPGTWGAASATPTSAAEGLGDWPTFLPSPTLGSVATGSAAEPALSYPGSPVLVRAAGGSVRVDVEGPSYPPGTKVGSERVEVTFAVTLSEASGHLDLHSVAFDVLDHQGDVRRLTTSGTPVPASIVPGQRVRLSLVGVVPAGEGLLRLYPDGQRCAAAWDYVTETD